MSEVDESEREEYLKASIISSANTGYLLVVLEILLFIPSILYTAYIFSDAGHPDPEMGIILLPFYITTVVSIVLLGKMFVYAKDVRNGKPNEILVIAYTSAYLFLNAASFLKVVSFFIMIYSYSDGLIPFLMYLSSYLGTLVSIGIVIAYFQILHRRSMLRDIQQVKGSAIPRPKDYFAPPPREP